MQVEPKASGIQVLDEPVKAAAPPKEELKEEPIDEDLPEEEINPYLNKDDGELIG